MKRKYAFEVTASSYGSYWVEECTERQALAKVAKIKKRYAAKGKRPKVRVELYRRDL